MAFELDAVFAIQWSAGTGTRPPAPMAPFVARGSWTVSEAPRRTGRGSAIRVPSQKASYCLNRRLLRLATFNAAVTLVVELSPR